MNKVWKKTIMSVWVMMIIFSSVGMGAVNASTVKVYGISASGPASPFYVNQTFQVKPKISTSNSKNAVKVWYKSGNTAVATVSATGIITAKGVGKTSIEIKAGDESAQLLVTVKTKVKTLALNAVKSQITEGEQTQLQHRVVMDSSSLPTPTVTYKVADPSIVHVDATGIVTALKEGKTDISIRVEEKVAKTSIEVTDIEWTAQLDQPRFTKPTWSADGKYVALNDLVVNAQDGRTLKDMNSDLAFVGNTLYGWHSEDWEQTEMVIYDSAFRVQREFEMPEEAQRGLHYAFSPDGQQFYFQYSHKGIFNLDLQSGEILGQITPDIDSAWDMKMTLSPDGQMLAILDGYGYMGGSRIFDINSGQLLGTTPEVGNAEFTPDSKYLVIQGEEGISIVDTQNFTTVRELPGEFYDFAVGTGGWLAVTNENGNVDIYDIETLEFVRSYATKENKQALKMGDTVNEPSSLTFSPDGRKLVASYNQYVYDPDNRFNTISWNLNGLYLE